MLNKIIPAENDLKNVIFSFHLKMYNWPCYKSEYYVFTLSLPSYGHLDSDYINVNTKEETP